MIEKGADMKVTDNFGRTLLHEWDPQPANQTQSKSIKPANQTADSRVDHFSSRLHETHQIGRHVIINRPDVPSMQVFFKEIPLKVRQLLESW